MTDIAIEGVELMDRDEALRLLRGGEEGIAEWNRRRKAGEGIPELGGADLNKANLSLVNLSNAHLLRANLLEANLSGADLRWTNLGAADLKGADLSRTNLIEAHVSWANLTRANLIEAKLGRAYLVEANLVEANLSGADFSDANLIGANLSWANLNGADLSRVWLGSTTLGHLDLSAAKGLDSIKHEGPSTVGIDTLFHSKGKIPEAFLRGCGVPEVFIEYLPSLISSMSPIQFYSCFISYSTADEEFASRLHNDFQAAGIRCWKWNHDARTGRSLWGEIDDAIRTYDKLVLIASESSLKSPAVNREIERAIVQEDERLKVKGKRRKRLDADVLVPIALDEYLFTKWKHERKVDVTKKVVADAKGWDSDAGIYAKIRDKLIRDLKAEESAGPDAPAPRPSRRKRPH